MYSILRAGVLSGWTSGGFELRKWGINCVCPGFSRERSHPLPQILRAIRAAQKADSASPPR